MTHDHPSDVWKYKHIPLRNTRYVNAYIKVYRQWMERQTDIGDNTTLQHSMLIAEGKKMLIRFGIPQSVNFFSEWL